MPPRFVITCEHASPEVPESFQGSLQPWMDELDEHRVWDPGTAEIAHAMAGVLQAPCFAGEWTRLLVDLNRSTHHRELFALPLRSLPKAARSAIIEEYHVPFRTRVATEIRKIVKTRRRVIHLSVHSFTPVFKGRDRRTDFALLYDPSRLRERGLAGDWLKSIHSAQPDWRLRVNFPYRGTADGHTTALRKLFAPEAYTGIELEFSQGLPLRSQGLNLGMRIAHCLQEAITA